MLTLLRAEVSKLALAWRLFLISLEFEIPLRLPTDTSLAAISEEDQN